MLKKINKAVIKVFGLSKQKIEDILNRFKQYGFCFKCSEKYGDYKIIITTTAVNGNGYQYLDEIISDFGSNCYANRDISLQQALYEILKIKNIKISVAESLTGGLVAAKIVDIAGISDYFIEGIVSYSNEAKVRRLNIDRHTLNTDGAVSSATAEQMVKGLINEGADLAVSTTGIAGPSGGSELKPVGLVWFGIGSKNNIVSVSSIFSGDRNTIRQQAANQALFLVLDYAKIL